MTTTANYPIVEERLSEIPEVFEIGHAGQCAAKPFVEQRFYSDLDPRTGIRTKRVEYWRLTAIVPII